MKTAHQKIAKTFSGALSIKLMAKLLTLISGVVLARILGPDGLGIYAISMSLIALLSIVAEAGMPLKTLRRVAILDLRAPRGAVKIAILEAATTVLCYSLLAAVILSGLLFLIRADLPPEKFATLAIAICAVPVFALVRVIISAIQGVNKVLLAMFLDMILRALLFVSIVLSVFLFAPKLINPSTAMLAQFIAALVLLAITIIYLKLKLSSQPGNSKVGSCRNVFGRASMPFMFIGAASVVQSQVDLVMINFILSDRDTGLYRVSVQGAVLVVIGLQASSAVLSPHFARLASEGDARGLQIIAKKGSRLAFFCGLPIAATFFLFGDFLVPAIFGLGYADAILPLKILCFAQLVSAFFGSVGFLLNFSGNEAQSAKTLVKCTLLNVLLNIFMIPAFGISGAASATALSLIYRNVEMARLTKKLLRVRAAAI